MKTKRMAVILILASTILLSVTSVCQAATPGQWARALYPRFCTGGSSAENWGCKAYIHYRIDYNKRRDEAKSTCYWACGKSQASNLSECKKGCDKARDQDGK